MTKPSLSLKIKRCVYSICEAKIDRMIHKIKDPKIKETYQTLFDNAKEVFSGKMDYVNWFFDKEVVFPSDNGTFNLYLFDHAYHNLKKIYNYYNMNIPGINSYSVVLAENVKDLLKRFAKIKEEADRLITLEERPLSKEKLLLVCKSNPNFEWYRVKKGDAFERRSLNDCCSNRFSDEIWTLREKKFNEKGKLIGHISRIHVGFNKNEEALKEIVGYSNNKPSPRYFKYFADLAKSGLFDKIFLEGEWRREENLVWEDLPEDMLKDIVDNNKKLLEIDPYLMYKFTGKIPPKITYWFNGNKRTEEYKVGGRLHREDGPAEIRYYRNGNVGHEYWYKNGERHREDGPAEIWYYENGNAKYECWYRNGTLYREDGPTEITYYENGNVNCEDWCKNWELHREDGPAEIQYYKNGNVRYEKWYKNGYYHRENGPALINYYENGNIKSEHWYKDDKKHREGGPAMTYYYENGTVINKYYFENGTLK